MEWGKLFSSLPGEPRVQAAEDDGGAGWLLIQSMCYAAEVETGGYIPDTQVSRFGGPRLESRVRALAREGLWIRDEKRPGWLLDPAVWSEARNLSDAVERKRRADRERIAAKRAAAREANGQPDLTRDTVARLSRDTSSDSVARQSHTRGEERREDTNPHP